MTSGVRIGQRLDRWLDECKMAIEGTVLATRDARFWAAFLLTFTIFGTLMNLLSGSSAALDLFWATNFGGKLTILGSAFLANFGIGKNFLDFILTFFITVLQSTLIGLVVLVWDKRRRSRSRVAASAHNASNVQDVGLAAGLAVLGSGCPTCGTTLLAPLISTIFSSGSYALASFISGFLTVAAVALALFAWKRIGREAYAVTISEQFLARKKRPLRVTRGVTQIKSADSPEKTAAHAVPRADSIDGATIHATSKATSNTASNPSTEKATNTTQSASTNAPADTAEKTPTNNHPERNPK